MPIIDTASPGPRTVVLRNPDQLRAAAAYGAAYPSGLLALSARPTSTSELS